MMTFPAVGNLYIGQHIKSLFSLSHVTAEIRRVSGVNPSFMDHERFEHDSPFRSLGQHPNGRQMDLEGWSVMQTEVVLFNGSIHTMLFFK